jgi:hypothetical protein
MGNSRNSNQMGHQSSKGGDIVFPGSNNWRGNLTTKRPHRRMETKSIILAFCDLLGISTAFLGWINNIDNIKSNILFGVGLAYFLVRLYFYFRRQKVALRKEEFEQNAREKLNK